MIILRDACPQSDSQRFKKNGHIHNGVVSLDSVYKDEQQYTRMRTVNS